MKNIIKNHYQLFGLLIGALLLGGCSSIPLSSMVKLAGMDEQTLASIHPQQVRARITLNEPARLKTETVKLALKFNYAGGSQQEYLFDLAPLDQASFIEPQWFGEDIHRQQTLFEIAETSVSEFEKYQRQFLKYGKPEKYHWTVYYYLASRPPAGQSIDLDLELKLASEEAFFYLLKGAELDVN